MAVVISFQTGTLTLLQPVDFFNSNIKYYFYDRINAIFEKHGCHY